MCLMKKECAKRVHGKASRLSLFAHKSEPLGVVDTLKGRNGFSSRATLEKRIAYQGVVSHSDVRRRAS